MSRGRKKYVPKRFESKGEKFIDENGKLRADTSANIYESLLLSDSFRDLSDRQKMLYIVAKAQYYGHRKPEKDYPEIELFQGADVFYLNWNAVKRYGLYKDSMHSNFYKDMSALIEHGFIQRLSSGKGNRKKSIYKFSADWQSWKPEKVNCACGSTTT